MEASVAQTCLVGPRLSAINPRLLIGWQTHAINGQPAPALLFGGVHARAAGKAAGLESEPCATATYQIHGHEDVAVTRERTPEPGHAMNLRAVRRGGNKEPSWPARPGAKSRGPPDRSVLRLLKMA